jgi:hypothetical protein
MGPNTLKRPGKTVKGRARFQRWRGSQPDGKEALDEGHGFSRAVNSLPFDGFSR